MPQALNRLSLFRFCLKGQNQAGVHGLSVHEYDTCTTISLFTALFRSGQTEPFAKNPQEGPCRLECKLHSSSFNLPFGVLFYWCPSASLLSFCLKQLPQNPFEDVLHHGPFVFSRPPDSRNLDHLFCQCYRSRLSQRRLRLFTSEYLFHILHSPRNRHDCTRDDPQF